ncbi:MAG: PorT family protein [Tannerellaceae bacterium]|nr:PorT family protein [Tannerellaceae bacterium]MCD8263791.1 PorT family protein [Tannerellaceae bacterium]
MKKTILLLFQLLLMMPLAAKVTPGVRVGGAYSSLVHKVEKQYHSGARFGFSIGGIVDIPVYKKLSVRPEVAFVNQGGSFLINQWEVEENHLYNRYNYYALQVPVNVVYPFRFSNVKLDVFAGPAFDFSLFGKMKSCGERRNIYFGVSEDKDLKTFDLGVNVGISVEYRKYFFSIQALCGTLDRRTVKNEGETSLYQNNVTFSFGYFFR